MYIYIYLCYSRIPLFTGSHVVHKRDTSGIKPREKLTFLSKELLTLAQCCVNKCLQLKTMCCYS